MTSNSSTFGKMYIALHVILAVANFSIGFKLSAIYYELSTQGVNYNDMFPFVMMLCVLLAMCYQVTYKRGGLRLNSKYFWLIVFLVYLAPLGGGFLFWKY